jgi:hypothetical protein
MDRSQDSLVQRIQQLEEETATLRMQLERLQPTGFGPAEPQASLA